MQIESEGKPRPVSSIVVVVSLLIIAIGLIVQITLAAHFAGEVDAATRKYLMHLAWIALVLLAFDLLLLFWVLIRFAGSRSQHQSLSEATPYVDAWAAAGERIQLDEEDEDQPQDDEEQQD